MGPKRISTYILKMVSRKALGMWGKWYPQNYKRLKKVLLFGFSFNSFANNLYQKRHLLLPLSHLTISYTIYCCVSFTMYTKSVHTNWLPNCRLGFSLKILWCQATNKIDILQNPFSMQYLPIPHVTEHILLYKCRHGHSPVQDFLGSGAKQDICLKSCSGLMKTPEL